MSLFSKIKTIFTQQGLSARKASANTGIPKSTIHYHRQRAKERTDEVGTEFWESEEGRNHTVRMVIRSVYIFAVRGGEGAKKIKNFLSLMQLDPYMGLSERTILMIIKQVESLILDYKSTAEGLIREKSEQLELILGVDETWFDQMLLVCQELSSGYIFAEEESEQRDAATWEKHIKKSLSLSTHRQNIVFRK